MQMIQIMVYMPIIKVNLPPNTEIFLESMRHIGEFKLFDTHDLIVYITYLLGFPEHEDTDPNHEQYKSSGFDTFNFTENMSYYIFLISLATFSLIILLILSCFNKCKKKANKMLRKAKKKWICSNTLRVISAVYLFTLISYALASKINSMNFNIAVGSVLGAYPIMAFFLLIWFKDSLFDRTILERYWSLYGNLKFKNTSALFYPLISSLRKVMFVFGSIHLE